MSQLATLCRNKVQAKLKEEIELCCDKEFFFRNKEFFFRDTAEEVCEEECRDTLDFVTKILTLSQHKRMKIADELCYDKRRLCHDKVWQGYNTSQLRQVFYVATKFLA